MLERQKEKQKKQRLKLADMVLKVGRERSENDRLQIEDNRTKVERVLERKLQHDKENIIISDVPKEKKEKLKKD